jgi:hypothetical protein
LRRRFCALSAARVWAAGLGGYWAAAGFKSTPTLGQSGALTGLQLFVRINCKLGLLGQEPVGKRIFVRANTMVGGFESLGREFQARVPAA